MANASDSGPAEGDRWGLDNFRQPPDEGLSLDELSQAFAQLLGTGSDPYATVEPPAEPEADAAEPEVDPVLSATQEPDNDPCEITPRSILEAMLFVGSSDNQPITSQQVASLMRGVRQAEVNDLVRDLNDSYAAMRCPYHVVSEGAGYRLVMREEFASIREKFQGRVRQAKLSPPAIEVLATVAYNQPITADEVNRLRDAPSGSLLAQMVRRQLLAIERDPAEPRVVRYRTTPRFMTLFGLESLDDLPRSQELDRQ